MKKVLLALFLGLVLVFVLGFLEKKDSNHQDFSMLSSREKNIQQSQNLEEVRKPAVAGQFYPEQKEDLLAVLENFLAKAEAPFENKNIRGLILPHAGYPFSGSVAAYGAKLLQGREIERVILIGSSHNHLLDKATIDGGDIWQTPLGDVFIDKDLAEKLSSESYFETDSRPHEREHSLEVELPFLQFALQDFKLLPILVSHKMDREKIDLIAHALLKAIDKKTVVVASTDLSHYPAYKAAQYVDKKVLDAILTGDIANLEETIENLKSEQIDGLDTCLCAHSAVEILMEIMGQSGAGDEIKLLKYANSGDVEIGDRSKVVGYGALAFLGEPYDYQISLVDSLEQEMDRAVEKKILEIARNAVDTYVKEGFLPDLNPSEPILNEELGAFVTLKKDNQLRGCMGRFVSSKGDINLPLYGVVSQMAMIAASKDPRFEPVSEEELGDLEYEISVLSPLRKIDDWREIKLGKHGVQVSKNGQSGIFLPQVATENNWDLETFMDTLCKQKAGLPADAWKNDPEADLYIFTAHIISE